jgi:hypothetical protein
MISSVESQSASVEAGYAILFVGLVCFVNERKERLVLLPDGRSVQGVTPHSPSIIVDPASVLASAGWPANERDEGFRQSGIFELSECTLEVTGANAGGFFDTKQHDAVIPRLKAADPNAEIDPATAEAVVRFNISSGTLEAFLTPDPNPLDPTDAAVISKLHVDYQDEITVKANGKTPERTLLLKPGTEIALANLVLHDDGTIGADHFSLYGQLTTTKTIHGAPPKPSPNTPPLPKKHHVFDFGFGIFDGGVKCGNTGCC